ncbi:MAG: 4-hydroxy-tetrahydrodipicolinate reductase [Gammaproteobacteria bacterium]|nr:4-hydroxy-tetrahydrodipicolinate reductase [Gammaproteobacteria bacterium]
MGLAIAASVDAAPDLELAGIWKRGEDLNSVVSPANVIVDFSLPAATDEVLAAATLQHRPLVCGVSGLSERQMQSLGHAAREIPIVYDRNMSLGVAVLERAVRDAAAALGQEFAIEISETHHIHKKDAPSGTALKLGEAIALARGEANTDALHYESQRIGEVPGDHEVVMRSPTERLTFSHSVTTRQVFVDGALRAARWIVDQPPGLYTMRDVLFGSGAPEA